MLRHFAAAACVVLLAGPAHAQGAFNMGTLTGTLSQDAVTQSEERRAGRARDGSEPRGYNRMKSLCAQRFKLSAQQRRSEDGREIERMCRAEGY